MHFIQHVWVDIVRNGPPRGFWCYSFEVFHQRLNLKMARNSNFKDVSRRIMRLWSLQFGKMLARRRSWYLASVDNSFEFMEM